MDAEIEPVEKYNPPDPYPSITSQAVEIRAVWVAEERQANARAERRRQHSPGSQSESQSQSHIDGQLSLDLDSRINMYAKSGRLGSAIISVEEVKRRIFQHDPQLTIPDPKRAVKVADVLHEWGKDRADCAPCMEEEEDAKNVLSAYGAALQIRESVLGRHHPQVTDVLSDAARYSQHLGHADTARQGYSRAAHRRVQETKMASISPVVHTVSAGGYSPTRASASISPTCSTNHGRASFSDNGVVNRIHPGGHVSTRLLL